MKYLALIYKLFQYNVKIIFAGKFIWFFLAALSLLMLLMIQIAWRNDLVSVSEVYSMLMLSGALIVFYPCTFALQSDADHRIMELIFGIPGYRYRVWGARFVMIYFYLFFILLFFAYLVNILLVPIAPLEIVITLMLPMVFMGNMAFMLSTLTRSGTGAAVLFLVIGVGLMTIGDSEYYSILLNPFSAPDNVHPVVWQNTLFKHRILYITLTIVSALVGLQRLQKREGFY